MGLDALADEIKHLHSLLSEDLLEPDPSRRDWPELRVRIEMVQQGLDNVLGHLEPSLAEAHEEELQALIRKRVAELIARTSVLLSLLGERVACQRLMERAAQLTSATSHRAELEAALKEPDTYVRYQHGLWLMGRDKLSQAIAVFERALRQTREPLLKKAIKFALKQSVRTLRQAPKPIRWVPVLFTLNGCGARLYGNRDRRADGSYVTTFCVCFLFIPILPLTAYRVIQLESRSYQFLSREPLSLFARAFQGLVLLGALVALGNASLQKWREAPSRLSQQALEAVQREEPSLDRQNALSRYVDVARTWETQPETRTAAMAAVARLTIASLPSPCTLGSEAAVTQALAPLQSLSRLARTEGSTDAVLAHLKRCVSEVEAGTPEGQRTRLELLAQARQTAKDLPEELHLQEAWVAQARRLAETLSPQRPLGALLLDAETLADDPEALSRVATRIEGLGASTSLWVEAELPVRQWMERARQNPALKPRVDSFEARLQNALASNAEAQALRHSDNAAALMRAWRAAPDREALALGVAERARQRGDLRTALETLKKVGPPGRLGGEAQLLLAQCHQDAGHLREAEAVLQPLVAEQMPLFRRAIADFEQARQEAWEKLSTGVDDGLIPHDLEEALKHAKSEAEMKRLAEEWIKQELAGNKHLIALQASAERAGVAVTAALSLATLELQRSRLVEGPEQRRLLLSAERAFLSVRDEEVGEARHLLGLGQVYHRLGRPEEGDAKLKVALDRKDPMLSMQVANVYRELGLEQRARTIAEQVYASSPREDIRHGAAFLLAQLASGEEAQEKWLRQSNPQWPEVQLTLDEVMASRAYLEGRFAEADALWAKVVAVRSRGAQQNATAANNSAVTEAKRYQATGDPSHLQKSLQYLEQAVRLKPDNALVLSNLRNSQCEWALLKGLERLVRIHVLRPDGEKTRALLDILMQGATRDELLKAIESQTSFRRAQELMVQEQALSPGRPTAWKWQWQWLEWKRDEQGMAALWRLLQDLPPFQEQAGEDLQRQWESSTDVDAVVARSVAQEQKLSENRLERARKTAHPPTVALAWWLLALDRQHGLSLHPEPAQVDAMVDAFREAAHLWPVEGLEAELRRGLQVAAVYRALDKSPALQAAWKAEGRVYSPTMLAFRVYTSGQGAGLEKVLRADPAFQEAVALAKKAQSPGQVGDWLLARLAGDEALERATASVFAQAEVERKLDVALRLSRKRRQEQALVDLFQQQKALKAQTRP